MLRKFEERLAAKREKEEQADSARGEPPAAVVQWRVPPDMVPEVLAVWEMCMVSRSTVVTRADISTGTWY